MTDRFVDLFDRERHGLNYWAAIAVCLGLLVGFGFSAAQLSYRVLVDGVRLSAQGGEPLTLGALLFTNLRFSVSGAVGLGLMLMASGALVKKDLFLPFVVAALMVLWGILMSVVGFVDAPAFVPDELVGSFVSTLLTVGSLVLCYRLLRNKVMALALGMAMGPLLMSVFGSIRYGNPIAWAAESAAAAVCMGFAAGVFLYGGITRHYSSHGVHFGEYGVAVAPEGAGAGPTRDPAMGKMRHPLVTLLLMLVTVNLYTLGWIYKVYSEIHRRPGTVTSVTPGKALGFLFIPVFNLFWALWLWLDLPRAIAQMEKADPPGGVPPDRWVITGSLFACTAMGLISYLLWPPALYLNAVLLWTGVLLAQSSLNSHWQAHRAIASK